MAFVKSAKTKTQFQECLQEPSLQLNQRIVLNLAVPLSVSLHTIIYNKSVNLLGFPGGSAGKESAYSARNLGSIPGLGRSPGEGNSYPLQYSGLENSMAYIVHGIAKNRTQLSTFHFHFVNLLQLLHSTTL